MKNYLGEKEMIMSKTEYSLYSQHSWAMVWIERYGSIDGDHHKAWLVDQLARILNGTEVIVRKAEWDNGDFEIRFSLKEPTQRYWDWVAEMKDGEDGAETYSYDFGIAP